MTQTDALRERFAKFLVDSIGLFVPMERWGEFERKLVAVARAFGFADVDKCMAWLLQTPLTLDQITVLAQHLTIGETYFFRDSALMSLLEREILPAIAQQRQRERRLRILSAGCCTGEEPYSLAILLTRVIADIDKWDVKIVGADLNADFLAKARRGHYRKWSFRGTPAEYKRKYFRQLQGEEYTLAAGLRELVDFVQLNLVEEEIGKRLGPAPFDLILCNNVLIYFSRDQVDRTVHKLCGMLAPQGWFIVTPIEAPFVQEPGLVMHHHQGVIAFRKEPAAQQTAAHAQRSARSTAPLTGSREPILLKIVLPAFLGLRESTLEVRYGAEESFAQAPSSARPAVPSDGAAAVPPSAGGPSVDKAAEGPRQRGQTTDQLVQRLSGLAQDKDALSASREELIALVQGFSDKGRMEEALHWCRLGLCANSVDPYLHFLEGTIHQAKDDLPAAKEALGKALFLEPDFVMAHFNMGMVEQRLGAKKEAQRHFRNVLDLLQRLAPAALLPGSEQMSAGQLKAIVSAMKTQ